MVIIDNGKILQELKACITLCDICFINCLSEDNATQMNECISLSRECAEICQLTASLLTRDSKRIDKYLKICSEACNACAEHCEKYEMEYCRFCAAVCRVCSKMCFEAFEVLNPHPIIFTDDL
jgi:hypothetical protein